MKVIYLFLLMLFFGCTLSQTNDITESLSTNNRASAAVQPMKKQSLPPKVKYAWMDKTLDVNESLVNQIALPADYERVDVVDGSFAEWLRFLPLLPTDAKVMLFDGREKPYQAGAHRVLNIDIGKSDLQQCADAIMRLKAEYHYSKGDYANIHFNYTSGHKVSFDDWSKGQKPIVSGNKVSFSAANGATDNSYPNFKKYLRSIFMFAGTASLEKEMKAVSIDKLKIGDVFIKGGFPGHAVLVVDMAVHKESGQKIFLLAQSYMPAQSIHILKNFEHKSALSPWYPADFGATLLTPEWDFDRNSSKGF
jgi:hypothetical protein